MREITIKNPAQSSAIAAVCALSSVLIGWTGMYLSGAIKSPARPAYSPGAFMLPFLWTIVFAAMGLSLYLIVGSLALTRAKISARNLSLTLWLFVYAFLISWLFFFYGMENYILAFVFAAFAGAVACALTVIGFKISRLNSLITLLVFLWIFYCGWLSLFAAI